MRYTFLLHQMTEHFIVVPETSYMYDPCVRCDLSNNPLTHFTECTLTRRFGDPELAGWEQEYKYMNVDVTNSFKLQTLVVESGVISKNI